MPEENLVKLSTRDEVVKELLDARKEGERNKVLCRQRDKEEQISCKLEKYYKALSKILQSQFSFSFKKNTTNYSYGQIKELDLIAAREAWKMIGRSAVIWSLIESPAVYALLKFRGEGEILFPIFYFLISYCVCGFKILFTEDWWIRRKTWYAMSLLKNRRYFFLDVADSEKRKLEAEKEHSGNLEGQKDQNAPA